MSKYNLYFNDILRTINRTIDNNLAQLKIEIKKKII